MLLNQSLLVWKTENVAPYFRGILKLCDGLLFDV